MDSGAFRKFADTFVYQLIGIGIAIGVALVGLVWLGWWAWNNISVVIK